MLKMLHLPAVEQVVIAVVFAPTWWMLVRLSSGGELGGNAAAADVAHVPTVILTCASSSA